MENEIVSLRMPKYKISNMVLFHIMFWIISIATNAYAFKISNQISWLDFYYAAFAHICLVTGIYINHFILIPFIFEPHHYKKYVIFIAIDASIMVFLYFFTFNSLVDIVLPDYYFVSQFNELETFIYCMAYLSFTTLLKLSESWFELQEKNKLMLITEKENMHHQLKALQSQINPHFLFNSLNVIYSQALKKSNELPKIIIKLSDILRYVIYKSKKDSIKTDEEVELINDYLSLQKYRTNDDCKINFKTEININRYIAPMLFLPLIENSFKHGIKGDYENTYVDISFISELKQTIFTIENNKGKKQDYDFDDEKGIGIENVKKRLFLLYPGKHNFSIQDNKLNFRVQVILEH